MHIPSVRRALGAVIVALAVAACAGAPATAPPAGQSSLAASSAAGAAVAAASVAPVVRTVLAGGIPAAAPTDKLELARYVIQPGTKLAAHHHPGIQLALIESGTLTYTVLVGSVTVHAADGTTRTIAAGSTGKIEAREWIAEDESIHHFGENAGTVPVVILASSLLEADEPPAIPDASSPATASPS